MLVKGVILLLAGVFELGESGLRLCGLVVNHIAAKVVGLQAYPHPASVLGLGASLRVSPRGR